VLDEELFATNEVHHMGQPIGLIIATSQTIATTAAKLVKVEYEKLPAIFTIEDAIAAKSFFPQVRHLKSGCFAQGKEVEDIEKDLIFVEGETRLAGQEHFYLESKHPFVVGHHNSLMILDI
jgi:xanthine dehydrogenase/oxidase